MHYYHNRHFIEDYESMSDWDSKWESPNDNSNYKVNANIDRPDHIKDYLDWW